jgi:hypothetical protein
VTPSPSTHSSGLVLPKPKCVRRPWWTREALPSPNLAILIAVWTASLCPSARTPWTDWSSALLVKLMEGKCSGLVQFGVRRSGTLAVAPIDRRRCSPELGWAWTSSRTWRGEGIEREGFFCNLSVTRVNSACAHLRLSKKDWVCLRNFHRGRRRAWFSLCHGPFEPESAQHCFYFSFFFFSRTLKNCRKW